MNRVDQDELMARLDDSFDIGMVADNVSDIANYAVEKHEFINQTTLPPELRSLALAHIKKVLGREIEELKRHRRELISRFFDGADDALMEVLEKHQ